jgi:hypothetical protein
MSSSFAESGGVQLKISIGVFTALRMFTALSIMACTSPTPDGPHELVREEVLGALVSREACRSAMTRMLENPTQPGVEVVSRTADSRTDKAGPYTVTSSFRCRLNMAAKPAPFVETTVTPSTPAVTEPVASQPVVTQPATTETDEAAERVYRELQNIERQRAGR